MCIQGGMGDIVKWCVARKFQLIMPAFHSLFLMLMGTDHTWLDYQKLQAPSAYVCCSGGLTCMPAEWTAYCNECLAFLPD